MASFKISFSSLNHPNHNPSFSKLIKVPIKSALGRAAERGWVLSGGVLPLVEFPPTRMTKISLFSFFCLSSPLSTSSSESFCTIASHAAVDRLMVRNTFSLDTCSKIFVKSAVRFSSHSSGTDITTLSLSDLAFLHV